MRPRIAGLIRRKCKVTEPKSTEPKSNGNGETKPPAGEVKPRPVFNIEHSLMGIAHDCVDIAQGVLNDTLEVPPAKAATAALSVANAIAKTQLQAIAILEKGSERARVEAARVLNLGTPDSEAVEPAKG
jgi:hypothetical protein